jgi:hypothetical protein
MDFDDDDDDDFDDEAVVPFFVPLNSLLDTIGGGSLESNSPLAPLLLVPSALDLLLFKNPPFKPFIPFFAAAFSSSNLSFREAAFAKEASAIRVSIKVGPSFWGGVGA